MCLCALSAAQRYRLGISITAIEYASRSYANMLAMDARVWRPGTFDAAPVDANGMPLQDCDIYILDGWFAQTHGTYGFNGTYRLIFRGQADIFFGGGTVQNVAYNAGTNTTTADIVVTESHPTLGMRLLNTRRTPASNVNTGVTGLKLMRPTSIGANTSYDPSTIFTTEYLALHNRGELLRSMDFVSTNGNIQANWSDRQLPGNLCYYNGLEGYWWQGKGAPWEDFIALCNAVDKDAWINIPVMATDDYVAQLARMLRDTLEPGRKIYVEYTNEVWNFAFPTWGVMNDLAEADLQANPGSSLNFDGACYNPDGSFNGGIAASRFWARRTMQVSDIFRAEFGDAAMHTGSAPRVFPLFETQASWQTWIYNGLTFLDRYYNNGDGNHVSSPRPVSSMIWGGGGSGYLHWFPEDIYNNPNATVDDIFHGYSLSWGEQYNAMVPSTHWCAAFGLKRVAYEGGLAAFDSGPARNASLAAQIDPRMVDAWKRCTDEFFRAGGELFVHYMSVRDDYGLMPFDAVPGNQPTPKLQAFDELMAAPARPEPTIGFAVPGTINAGRYHVASDGWSTGQSDNPINFGAGYNWTSYTIRSTAPRSVTLRLLANASANGVARVMVNGVSVGQVNLVAGVPSSPIVASLGRGVGGIRVQRVGGSFALQSISVEAPPAMTLALEASTVVSAASTTGTVTLEGPAPAGGTIVALSTSSAVAGVPISVTVPEGQSSATFQVKATTVDRTSKAKIKAVVGKTSASSLLTIEPMRIAGLVVEPGSVLGGSRTAVWARITLSAPAPANTRVDLTSSHSAASVPAYAKVKAGETSAQFRVKTSSVAVDVSVRLTATVGSAANAATLVVQAPTLTSVTLKPSSLIGGQTTAGTVTLNGPAPAGGLVVVMRSSSKSAAVAATVNIPAGTTSAAFDVTTVPVPVDTIVTISGKLGAVTRTASLSLRAPALQAISLDPTTVTGGSSSAVTATVTLATPAPASGLWVNLSSSNTAAASVPARVKVAGGATSAAFPVAHRVVTANTRVTIGASLNGVSKAARLTVKR